MTRRREALLDGALQALHRQGHCALPSCHHYRDADFVWPDPVQSLARVADRRRVDVPRLHLASACFGPPRPAPLHHGVPCRALISCLDFTSSSRTPSSPFQRVPRRCGFARPAESLRWPGCLEPRPAALPDPACYDPERAPDCMWARGPFPPRSPQPSPAHSPSHPAAARSLRSHRCGLRPSNHIYLALNTSTVRCGVVRDYGSGRGLERDLHALWPGLGLAWVRPPRRVSR